MPIVKSIDLADLGYEIQRYAREFKPQVKSAVVSGCLRSIPDLVQASPVDTGLYAQSWGVEETENSVQIGNTAPHAPIIEFGARPHTPPIGPLLAWAKRVLKDPSQPPNYSQEVWRLALGVQKKIQAQGQAPRSILRDNTDKIIDNIRTELEKLK